MSPLGVVFHEEEGEYGSAQRKEEEKCFTRGEVMEPTYFTQKLFGVIKIRQQERQNTRSIEYDRNKVHRAKD